MTARKAPRPPKARVVEDCLRVSLPDLRRRGCIQTNHRRRCTFVYERRGATIAEVSVIAHAMDDDDSWLDIKLSWDGVSLHQRVELERRPQPFGGYQWLALCPLSGRRCAILLLPPGGAAFACRAAHGLTYSSCREPPVFRALRRAARAEERIASLSRYARRPTRDRLLRDIMQGEIALEAALCDASS